MCAAHDNCLYNVALLNDSAGACLLNSSNNNIADICISAAGATKNFTATVAGSGDYADTVTWTVTGGGEGTSVSGSGVLTVAAGETAETLTVTATSTQDPTKAASATVTVGS